jgi:glycosyltransferase involved in cell wall biosynthesis
VINSPRVSICIPAYNGAALISRTIDSALSQSDGAIEVVLIDDASTDDTLKVAASYNDPRFRIESNECRLGHGGNFNRCLDVAHGRYVKILCHDDVLYPGAIALLADGLDRFPDATFATSAWDEIDTAGSLLRTNRLLKNAPANGALVDLRRVVRTSWLYRNRIGCPSNVLLRKAALHGLRFNSEYAQMMDWDLWLHLLKRGPLIYVPQVLSALRLHEKSLSVGNRPRAQTASDLLHVASELTSSSSELRGAVSKFDVKRLLLLCFISALGVALRNAMRGHSHAVIESLRIAKRAFRMLVG